MSCGHSSSVSSRRPAKSICSLWARRCCSPTATRTTSRLTVRWRMSSGYDVSGASARSQHEQLPRGVKLLDLTPPRPMLTVNAVWRRDHELPAIERLFETAKELAQERHW